MKTSISSSNGIAPTMANKATHDHTNGAHPPTHHPPVSLKQGTPIRDRWVYRVIVLVLGLTIMVSIGGSIALALANQAIPESIVALGSAAIGALAGVLAPVPQFLNLAFWCILSRAAAPPINHH